MLAPIVLFVYNRPEHTKKTIEALLLNPECKNSDLFIFSDAPKIEKDEKNVQAVRDYINQVKGFKSITIKKSEFNMGLANSVINGITEIINRYGKVIVLEDDLITSSYFLKYMNEALNIYESRQDIWSISGYSPNLGISSEYKSDIYLTFRGCSWGWATWNNRWNKVDWEVNDYDAFSKDKKCIKEFNKSGNDLFNMLKDQMCGRIDSWAIRWCYAQFRNQMLTVYPVKSLIKNIGTDLSGTHSPGTKRYEVQIYEGILVLDKNIDINKDILNLFKLFYNLRVTGYISILSKKIGLHKFGRKVRNTIFRLLSGRSVI